MRRLKTWFCQHDFLRQYAPGHLWLRCERCGLETPGLHGPTTHVEPPVITKRRVKKQKGKTAKPILRVVPAEKTRRMA